MSTNRIEELSQLLKSKLGDHILTLVEEKGELVLVIERKGASRIFQILKEDKDLNFKFLSSITAVDWLDKKDFRFEVVYHLMNLSKFYRLRVKVAVPEEDAAVETVLPLWASADFLESEVWDMFGIQFRGNPDVRRMLMYPEFEGHPLRKDYPVQGKQPRVQFRSPEVRNTAEDMIRSDLIQINKKKGEARV